MKKEEKTEGKKKCQFYISHVISHPFLDKHDAFDEICICMHACYEFKTVKHNTMTSD